MPPQTRTSPLQISFCAGVLLLTLGLPVQAASTQYDCGDPSADEQLVLEYINRARANPTAEGTRLGIDITEGLPDPSLVKVQPPLAMNKILLGTARAHSQDMYNNSYFAHNDLNGNTPFDRMTAAGYNWNVNGGKAGENIAEGSDYSATALEDLLMVDAGISGRGHRVNLLDITSGPVYREVGVGFVSATALNGQGVNDLLTQDFGTSSTGPFLVGVVYKDNNGNNFYDKGEGVSGVTISPGSGAFFAVSSTSGGYAFPIGTSGSLTVTASGGSLSSPISKTITLSGANMKLDFIVSGGGGAPVISSSTSATGTINQSFNYQITASNSPTSFNATPLPNGLSVNTSTGAITGTPSATGTTNVTISATNASGTGSATLNLTINSSGNGVPAITSSTSATGTVNQAFSYQITASNTPTSFNATSLPDGLSVDTSTGAITGTPSAAGTTNVTISATNANGTGSTTLTLTINSSGGGSSGSNSLLDTDGDGFPDEIEIALGTDPNDPANTPFGSAPAGPWQDLLNVKLAIKLDFTKGGRDSVTVAGTLPVGGNFVVEGRGVVLDVGGVVRYFQLDKKGASTPRSADSFKLRVRTVKKAVPAQDAKFTAKFTKGAFSGLLSDEGLVGTADAKGAPLDVPVIAVFNGALYFVNQPQLYYAKQGKKGYTK